METEEYLPSWREQAEHARHETAGMLFAMVNKPSYAVERCRQETMQMIQELKQANYHCWNRSEQKKSVPLKSCIINSKKRK